MTTNDKRIKSITLAYDSVSWLPSEGTMFDGSPITQAEIVAVADLRRKWNEIYCRNHGI